MVINHNCDACSLWNCLEKLQQWDLTSTDVWYVFCMAYSIFQQTFRLPIGLANVWHQESPHISANLMPTGFRIHGGWLTPEWHLECITEFLELNYTYWQVCDPNCGKSIFACSGYFRSWSVTAVKNSMLTFTNTGAKLFLQIWAFGLLFDGRWVHT